jgi:hypothetical protein
MATTPKPSYEERKQAIADKMFKVGRKHRAAENIAATAVKQTVGLGVTGVTSYVRGQIASAE